MKKLTSILILLALAQLGLTQVTVESVMKSDGFMGQGAFESKSKTFVQGEAQRSETQFKFTGSLMKHFSPKGTEVNITLLDKQLIWQYNDKEKTYRETTFAELKELFEKGENEIQQTEMPKMKTEDNRESEYEWEKPVVKVENLHEKKKINDFNCDHYLVSFLTIGTHKATGIKDTLSFVSDLWNTKGLGDATKTVSEFQIKYMEALGFERKGNMGLAMLSTMYLDQMKDLEKEVSKLEGYPILNEMTLTSSKHATASQKTGDDSEPAEQNTDGDIALDDIKGSLGGLFGKKLGNMAKQKVEKKKSQGNNVQLVRFASETKKVKLGPIKSDKFTVPDNLKLKD
jgi:hypothetical protein